MIKSLAMKIAEFGVGDNTSQDFEELTYGYELLLQELAAVSIALIIAFPFGIISHVFIAIISYDVLRHFAGGAHAKHRSVCLIFTVLIQFVPGFLFSKTSFFITWPILLVLYILCAVLLLLYAPADTVIKPIKKPEIRKRLKLQSLLILSILYATALIVYRWGVDYASLLAVICLIECCMIHPLSYKLFGCKRSK